MSGSHPVHGPRTYGNWRRPGSAGLGTMGLLATALVFGGLIVGIVVMGTLGWQYALVVAALTIAVVLAVTLRDQHGTTPLARGLTRARWWRAKGKGSNLYRSGPLGRTRWGTTQLPGLAASSRLSEFQDAYGRPFAMLHVPSTSHYTVVISSEPDGAALVDESTIDDWVSQWGLWIAALGHEPGLVAASVTVETAPDTGFRLRREIDANLAESASDLARQMLAEVSQTWPDGSATVRAWIALTFAARSRGSTRRRSEDEVGRDLATRMPGLTQALSATGAGVCRPLSARELCEAVRTAYDPGAERVFDDVRASGEDHELRWTDVGPVAAQAGWDHYLHDDAVSVTWMMTSAPRGLVRSSVLNRLMAPHPDITRKRVTMLYRPYDAGAAARIVEADRRNADVRASGRRPSARAVSEQRSANAVAAEEATGAGLVDFGLLVTATVLNDGVDTAQRVAEARAAVDGLAASARLMLRPAYGSQDVAFAAALPLGLVLPLHLQVPAIVREVL